MPFHILNKFKILQIVDMNDLKSIYKSKIYKILLLLFLESRRLKADPR